MAHFAKLSNKNIVEAIIVIDNNELIENGIESEQKGINFCNSLFGGTWVQTSYNSTFRKNYAGIGYAYDPYRNAFIPPKPFNSWILDENTCHWKSPIEYPTDGKIYEWSEENLNWIEVVA